MSYVTHFLVTVYREAPPLSEKAEFCEIWVEPITQAGDGIAPVEQSGRWVVQERHGWWDSEQQQLEQMVVTLSPTDPEHAWDADKACAEAKRQVGRRASEGFRFAARREPDFATGQWLETCNEVDDQGNFRGP